ncbi:MAG: HAMP domain-containing histidine kinase [Defluviitaleaceae bacterium]|nr:HAMP domain-containing histidine kinase [Defluviitaleaceae bacterium]
MTILGIACVILAIALVTTLILWLRLKGDIRQLGKSLSEIINTDTNAQLCTNTFDKDVTALLGSANDLLAKSRRDFIEAQRTEEDLKRAITNISHDLRTPLTSAKGYLQILDGTHVDETTARYLATIRGRLENLTVLMDDLFAFSRALEGNTSANKVNISSVLRDALSENYEELKLKGFVVESSIPDTPVYCYCDEDALKRVLQNLLKNAHTHGKEYLCVSLSNTIKVANKADGLDSLDINRIFDRFYTADAARTHKRTGLGLAIAKELTMRMGGTISAEVRNDMLTVCISLPGLD